MRIESTLKISFILLFLIAFNANADENKKPTNIEACNAAINKGDATSALNLADGILAKEKVNQGALLCKGRALGLKGEYKNAQPFFEQAITSANNNFEKAIAYILQGNLHKEFDKSAEAINSYEKSLLLTQSDANKQYSRINYNLIGNIHKKDGDLEAAINSYLQGAELANNDNERADSYERLAANYSILGQHDSAIAYQLKATIMQKQAGGLEAFANSSVVLGQIQLKAKEYANAERTFKKLEKFSIENGGAYYEAVANFYLAETKALTNDKKSANALLTKARNIAKKIGAKDLSDEIDAFDATLNK